MTRRLLHESDAVRVYEMVDVDGNVAGTDTEAVPTAEDKNESTVHTRAEAALDDLRTLASGSGTMTTAQLSVAVRLLARVAVVLLRISLRRFDATD